MTFISMENSHSQVQVYCRKQHFVRVPRLLGIGDPFDSYLRITSIGIGKIVPTSIDIFIRVSSRGIGEYTSCHSLSLVVPSRYFGRKDPTVPGLVSKVSNIVRSTVYSVNLDFEHKISTGAV